MIVAPPNMMTPGGDNEGQASRFRIRSTESSRRKKTEKFSERREAIEVQKAMDRKKEYEERARRLKERSEKKIAGLLRRQHRPKNEHENMKPTPLSGPAPHGEHQKGSLGGEGAVGLGGRRKKPGAAGRKPHGKVALEGRAAVKGEANKKKENVIREADRVDISAELRSSMDRLQKEIGNIYFGEGGDGKEGKEVGEQKKAGIPGEAHALAADSHCAEEAELLHHCADEWGSKGPSVAHPKHPPPQQMDSRHHLRDDLRKRMKSPYVEYYPWGRPGGGAPNRTASGRVSAVRKSWEVAPCETAFIKTSHDGSSGVKTYAMPSGFTYASDKPEERDAQHMKQLAYKKELDEQVRIKKDMERKKVQKENERLQSLMKNTLYCPRTNHSTEYQPHTHAVNSSQNKPVQAIYEPSYVDYMSHTLPGVDRLNDRYEILPSISGDMMSAHADGGTGATETQLVTRRSKDSVLRSRDNMRVSKDHGNMRVSNDCGPKENSNSGSLDATKHSIEVSDVSESERKANRRIMLYSTSDQRSAMRKQQDDIQKEILKAQIKENQERKLKQQQEEAEYERREEERLNREREDMLLKYQHEQEVLMKKKKEKNRSQNKEPQREPTEVANGDETERPKSRPVLSSYYPKDGKIVNPDGRPPSRPLPTHVNGVQYSRQSPTPSRSSSVAVADPHNILAKSRPGTAIDVSYLNETSKSLNRGTPPRTPDRIKNGNFSQTIPRMGASDEDPYDEVRANQSVKRSLAETYKGYSPRGNEREKAKSRNGHKNSHRPNSSSEYKATRNAEGVPKVLEIPLDNDDQGMLLQQCALLRANLFNKKRQIEMELHSDSARALEIKTEKEFYQASLAALKGES
eukprot:Nk52_evm59s152 gene=Nk52_evmTU59s152